MRRVCHILLCGTRIKRWRVVVLLVLCVRLLHAVSVWCSS